MNELRIREAFKCAAGCGRLLYAEGICAKCSKDIEALDKLYDFDQYKRPKRRDGLFHYVMTGVAVAVLMFILYNFAAMFADWIADGGGPWQ